jgi:hypothetical protein
MLRRYKIKVIDHNGTVIANFEKESKWSHDRMSAWLQRKYHGVWKRISVTST